MAIPARMVPKTKIITGVPYYARAGWGDEWLLYKDVIKMYPTIADTLDFIIYNKNNFDGNF